MFEQQESRGEKFSHCCWPLLAVLYYFCSLIISVSTALGKEKSFWSLTATASVSDRMNEFLFKHFPFRASHENACLILPPHWHRIIQDGIPKQFSESNSMFGKSLWFSCFSAGSFTDEVWLWTHQQCQLCAPHLCVCIASLYWPHSRWKWCF